MRRAISYCIRKVLKEKERVYLKGIGTLRLSFDGKKSNRVAKLVLNPEKKSSNKQLIKIVRKEYKLNKKRSSDLYDLYNKIILKKLKKHSLVTIPTVAVLSRKNDEIAIKSLIDEKVKAQTKKKSLKQKKKIKGLKDSIMTASSQIVEEVVKPKEAVITKDKSEVKETKVTNRDEDIDQELLDELSYLNQLNHGVPQKDELKEALKDHFYQEDAEDVIVETPAPIDNTKYVQPPQPKQAHVETHTDSFNYRPWLIGVLSLISFALLVYFGSKIFIQPKANEIKPTTKEIGLIESGGDPAPIENDESDLSSTPSLEKCIIITGSYSQIRYEEQRRNLILEKGYTPYTETHNGLTRVGIELDCTEENLESLLTTIRESIDDEAWLLYPPHLSI